ncbi:pheromone B alpha 1 receptor [Flammula alnicola]|nr:pheromone B alpha 1 receptor [Flammula alnicola]
MTYPNAIFSVFAFTGFLMCTIPFAWHLEAWNTGTCLYMAWAGLACLTQFVNSIVWNRNAINWNPIWCDISSRIIIGTSIGIPAASLCINRRLYHISAVQSVTITKAEKLRNVLIDLAIGLGLPVMGMILQYIPQGHRFNIFEDVGCYPFTYNTWVAFPLVYCPPVVIGLVSAVYATLSIKAFNKSRSQFNELLSSYNNLTSSRYIRLMCLAGIEVLCTVPFGSYAIYLNIKAGINPWISWENVHVGFSRVDQFPSLLWRSNPVAQSSIELTRWLCVICAFIFFAFFGFADEAKKHYRYAFETVAKRVGLSTGSTGSSGGVLTSTGFKSKGMASSGKVRPIPPVFVHRDLLRHQGSISSFTDISVSIADVSGHLDEKKDDVNEKEEFMPTLSYGGLTLSDVGGTLADYSEGPYSAAPSSGSSSSSSSPSIVESPSNHSAPSLPDPTDAKSNTHDIV